MQKPGLLRYFWVSYSFESIWPRIIWPLLGLLITAIITILSIWGNQIFAGASFFTLTVGICLTALLGVEWLIMTAVWLWFYIKDYMREVTFIPPMITRVEAKRRKYQISQIALLLVGALLVACTVVLAISPAYVPVSDQYYNSFKTTVMIIVCFCIVHLIKLTIDLLSNK